MYEPQISALSSLVTMVGGHDLFHNLRPIFSNLRFGMNQMPSILHGPFVQMKGPKRARLFHKPNHKPVEYWLTQ